MVSNTVNGKKDNSTRESTQKRFKPAGRGCTPKIVVAEIRQNNKENEKHLITAGHTSVSTLISRSAKESQTDYVSIKAYDGGNPEKENKKNKKQKSEDIIHD